MSVRLESRKRLASEALDVSVQQNKRVKIEQSGIHDGNPVDVPSTLQPSSAMSIDPQQNQREITQLITSTDTQKLESLFYGNFPQNAPQTTLQPQPITDIFSDDEEIIGLQLLDHGAAERRTDLQSPDDESEFGLDQTIDSQEIQQRPNTPETIEAPRPHSQVFRNIPLTIRENPSQPVAQIFPPIQTQINDDEAPLALFSQSMDYDSPFSLDSPEVITKWMGHVGLGRQNNELSPGHSFVLGCSTLERKEYAKAREYFTKALESDPENNALLGLASCDFYEGKYSEAIDRLKPVLNTSCAYAAAQFKMGCCYAKQNNLPEAIKHFERVPRNYSFSSRAQYNIGCLYYNQKEKDYPNAINHFKNVSQNTSKFNASQYYLGLCYIAQNQLDRAHYHLGQIQKKSRYFSAAKTLLLILDSIKT